MANLRINDLMHFSPETYVRFLTYLRHRYRIVPFRDIASDDSSYLILRHDVDISVLQAQKLAEIENRLGLKATYFILVSSMHYNSLEGNNASAIRKMAASGHEIGLHYDVSQYKLRGQETAEAIEFETNVLEQICGQKVTAISCHAPKGPEAFVHIKGYVDADDPRLRDVYVCDSQSIWTIRSLSTLLNLTPKRVLLNTHPKIWMASTDRNTKLDDFLLHVLLLLYRIRAVAMRLVHSQEVCPS